MMTLIPADRGLLDSQLREFMVPSLQAGTAERFLWSLT